jgi:hypothetical protein
VNNEWKKKSGYKEKECKWIQNLNWQENRNLHVMW